MDNPKYLTGCSWAIVIAAAVFGFLGMMSNSPGAIIAAAAALIVALVILIVAFIVNYREQKSEKVER